MAMFRIGPTELDEAVANDVAEHARPPIETLAEILTWGADERVVCLAAAAWWFACRRAPAERRNFSNHVLVCSLVASALPHALKAMVSQERPDRRARHREQHGIPKSGNRDHAFPSGHAVHIGALAGAASLLPQRKRNAAWTLGAVLATTRVALLAHWPSDVVAGLATGALLERVLRPLTLKSTRTSPELKTGAGPRSEHENPNVPPEGSSGTPDICARPVVSSVARKPYR